MDAVATPPVAASPAVTRETLMANSRLTFEDKVIEKSLRFVLERLMAC